MRRGISTSASSFNTGFTITSDAIPSISFVEKVIETSCRSEFGREFRSALRIRAEAPDNSHFLARALRYRHRPCFPYREIDLDVYRGFVAQSRSASVSMRTPIATTMIELRFSRSVHSQTQAIWSGSEFSTNSKHRVLIESSLPQPPILFLNQEMGV